ncbi:MAG: protein kinase [Mesorhizobium sp.]
MSADDKTRLLPNMADTTVGTQLSGIYELDERIASGGMGEVYRGHNIQTGDHVAIKIVLPEFARDQTILSLFRKEASILNHLSHDAVVRYHVFTIDTGIGRPYLAMEFVDGESLYDVMRRGAMATGDVRKLCHRLASGLSAVHEAGAIHRDLSPDNIILPGGRVDRAKIIDFGIARSATIGGETLIGGKFAGKYNYVSPEQLGLYGGDVGEQSDIYSLGLVLAAALRGKPIDMAGSQFEIVEKRRTVPDLSDIDADFRPIIEAMLQSAPQDRPESMADIAAMTRGNISEETDRTTAVKARDERTGGIQTGRPVSITPSTTPPPSAVLLSSAAIPEGDEPRFVPHVRPAHLSQPKAAPIASARASSATKPATTRNLTIAALAAIVVAAGAGLYASGFVDFGGGSPVTSPAKTPPLQPDLSNKPAAVDKPASTPETPPAKVVSPVQPQTENPAAPAESQANAAPAQEPVPPPVATPPPTVIVPEPKPDTLNSSDQKPAQPVDKAVELQPPAEQAAPPAQPDVVKSPQPEPPASPPAEPQAAAPEPPAQTPEPTAQAPEPSQPNAGNAQSQPADVPAERPADTAVVLNVPKPETPPAPPVDEAAQRVAWVRDFSGGDCFYATVTSATDTAVAIEGIGTTVPAFEQMLGDFQAKFHIEPDISVRLIEPSQCEVTNFLRFLGASAADKPQLVLDQTSVPNGSPISGTLVTHGGLVSSVLLIDHKGMAFNLDDRVIAESDKATFSIPIGLGAADKAAGKAVPQLIMVITGPEDIQATAFSTPVPAWELLPRILDEIGTKESEYSATAKYFRLGG